MELLMQTSLKVNSKGSPDRDGPCARLQLSARIETEAPPLARDPVT